MFFLFKLYNLPIYTIFYSVLFIYFLKLWYIYTMEFCAAERKKELIPFAMAWMELESIMLSEIFYSVLNEWFKRN